MGWKVTIMLFEEGQDQVRHVAFEGDSPQDLAMLGAAKGFLEGLYEESKGARSLVGMLPALEQMEETLQRIINPRPRLFPPFRAGVTAAVVSEPITQKPGDAE